MRVINKFNLEEILWLNSRSISKILDIISFKGVSVVVGSLAIASALLFVNQNYSQIKSHTFLGSGINKYGYDFKQILVIMSKILILKSSFLRAILSNYYHPTKNINLTSILVKIL